MEHPPSNLDLTPCDFWLFPVFKKALSGWQFCSYRELLTATQTFFNHLQECRFCKTFEDNWLNTCRNIKTEAEMKMLVAIANKIFQLLLNRFFPLKIVTGIDDLDFTRQAIPHMLFTIESYECVCEIAIFGLRAILSRKSA